MKNIILLVTIMLLTIMTGSAQMADYEVIELPITLNKRISHVELTIVIDDIYYETKSFIVEGNGHVVSLYITQGLDYHLIINGEDYIMITVMDREVIDDRDLSISADLDYKFVDGILTFY